MHEVRTVNYCLHNVLQCNLLYGAMNGIAETASSNNKKGSQLAQLGSIVASFHKGKHISVLD